jgi:integral membrane protein (TIGR01906 family)
MLKKMILVSSWVVTVLLPFALLMLGVRLLMTPLFLEVEYRLPGFPEDSFGFSQADRLRWSKPSVEYLVNDAPPSFLADLRFDNGKPIYNEREVSHMLDVKNVVQKLLNLWLLVLAVLAGFGVWAWRADWLADYRLGLKRGGFLTVALLLALGGFASISFWQFFTWFHSLFFSGDSWLFSYSDTLIRLFPIRFWEDAVAWIGGFSVLSGLALGFGLKPKSK